MLDRCLEQIGEHHESDWGGAIVSNRAWVKLGCLFVIGVPSALATVQGISLSPTVAAVMTLANLLAGLILSELEPGWRNPPQQ